MINIERCSKGTKRNDRRKQRQHTGRDKIDRQATARRHSGILAKALDSRRRGPGFDRRSVLTPLIELD